MTCENSADVSIRFPNSGIHIRPFSADIRKEARNYRHARFSVTEDAGYLVSNNVHSATPADVLVDGEKRWRMFLPEGEEITFMDSIEGTDKVNIDLFDPRKVMKRGNLNRRWNATLGEAVDYVFSNRSDPEEVIKGYQFIDGEDSTLTVEPDDADFLERASAAEEFVYNLFVEDFAGKAELARKGASPIEFRNISPFQAMEKLMSMFELNWWVDNEGYMKIGGLGTENQLVLKTAGNDNIVFSEYAVTREPDPITAVHVRGSFKKKDAVTQQKQNTGLNAMAEASIPLEGDSVYIKSQTGFTSLQEVSNLATITLVRRMMNDNSGTATINASASENKAALSRLDTGDHIVIGDGITDKCRNDVTSGLFLVTNITHTMEGGQGWSIEISLSRVPKVSDIETKSVLYDPLRDQKYRSYQAYQDGPGVAYTNADDPLHETVYETTQEAISNAAVYVNV